MSTDGKCGCKDQLPYNEVVGSLDRTVPPLSSVEMLKAAIPVAACPRSLARQDLLKRPLDPIDFFADHSDRLLVFQWVGHRSDSFHCASYFVTPIPNEVEPCASLLAISVNAADELSGKPGKYRTKQHLNRNAIGCAVKL